MTIRLGSFDQFARYGARWSAWVRHGALRCATELALPTNGGRSDGRIDSGKGVMMARKKYTKEFKEQACRLVLNGTHTPTEAAKELGLLRETLSGWIRRSGLRPPGRQPLDLG